MKSPPITPPHGEETVKEEAVRLSPLELRRFLAVTARFLRHLLRFSALLALVWLGMVSLGFHLIGHRNPTIAFMLYLPAWLWALPCLLLLAPCLLFDTLRSGVPLFAALALYLGPILGYQWRGSPASKALPQSLGLRVMSYNRGQGGGTSLQPFKKICAPDILALQDAGRMGAGEQYRKAEGYSEFGYGSQAGEFVLLSRFPIVEARLVMCSPGGYPASSRAVGARFEVEWRGKVIVYSVHLPTPRGMLYSERSGGFLAGVLGLPGTPWAEKRQHREAYWEYHLGLAEDLAKQIRKESLPVIVVGDFNAPPFGPMYHAFSSFLEDGHSLAGKGYGYNFPGETRNPLALKQPWLRLDYIFCSARHWRASQFVTEPSRPSQHRAVFAEFLLISSDS
jgi:vancomycin resistance protein VanJ